jgi:hypothetical protein
LSLAENLLRAGNPERALQLADPVLGNVNISTLNLLTLVREKDAAAADQRYAAMLASTSNNMAGALMAEIWIGPVRCSRSPMLCEWSNRHEFQTRSSMPLRRQTRRTALRVKAGWLHRR